MDGCNDKQSGGERKIFSSDPVYETPVEESAVPIHEFHGHKALTLKELELLALRADKAVEEEDDDLPEFDWEEHRANTPIPGPSPYPSTSTPDEKTSVSASGEAKPTSPRDPRLKAKTTHASEPLRETDYYAGIPQNEKDEEILSLVLRKQDLEKKIQYWSDWARDKVVQTTKRLTQDQAELKQLRKEKEEEEKLNKEKQILEDSMMKRVFEMESALSKTAHQMEVADSYFHELQEENTLLKIRMGVSNLQATQASQRLEETLQREKDAVLKCQSLGSEKGQWLDQLEGARKEAAELNNQLEKKKGRQARFEVLLRKEEGEKLKAIAHCESLKSKREGDEALAVAEAENITQTAERNIQKANEDIKNLEAMISEQRLIADRSKIAALNMACGSSSSSSVDLFAFRSLHPHTKRLPAVVNNFDSERARECVMCMSEEISVVFLPCAHQVLCVECNIRHEKQGMNDCPSCRTTIERRIPVQFRQDAL